MMGLIRAIRMRHDGGPFFVNGGNDADPGLSRCIQRSRSRRSRTEHLESVVQHRPVGKFLIQAPSACNFPMPLR